MSIQTSDFPKLTHTPIKEIVLGVSFDGPLTQDGIGEFSRREVIQKQFPVSNQTFNAKFTLSAQGAKSEASSRLDGLLLKNDEPANKVLQVRIGSVSYHRLQHYEALDKLIEELTVYWNELQSITDEIKVTSIYVRYINLIPADDTEDLSEFVTVYPTQPFGHGLNGFITVGFEMNESDVTLTTTTGELNGEKGIIIDYTIRKTIVTEGDEFLKLFHELRTLKNIVFFNSITERTVKYFQS